MITYVFEKLIFRIVTGLMLLGGSPQRSILGSPLFNTFINDIFLFIEKSDICKFADDSTLFSCGDNLSAILKRLEHDMKILLRWFK